MRFGDLVLLVAGLTAMVISEAVIILVSGLVTLALAVAGIVFLSSAVVLEATVVKKAPKKGVTP